MERLRGYRDARKVGRAEGFREGRGCQGFDIHAVKERRERAAKGKRRTGFPTFEERDARS